MSVNSGRARLYDAYKKFSQSWDRTTKYWQDSTRDDFEKQYIAPLEGQVRATLNAMSHMNDVLNRARRDCS